VTYLGDKEKGLKLKLLAKGEEVSCTTPGGGYQSLVGPDCVGCWFTLNGGTWLKLPLPRFLTNRCKRGGKVSRGFVRKGVYPSVHRKNLEEGQLDGSR